MKVDQEKLLRCALLFSETCNFELRNDIEYVVGAIARLHNLIGDLEHNRVPAQEHHPVEDLKVSVSKGLKTLVRLLVKNNPHFILEEYLLKEEEISSAE